MKKHIGICLALFLTVGLLTGCGAQVSRTTVHVKNNGKVVENVAEDFDKEYYDEKELEKFIDQSVDEYTEETGKKDVKAKGFSVKDKKAYLTMKYKSTDAYMDFNQETLYAGTIVQAIADGYTLPEEFYPVKDGKLKKTATDKSIKENDEYKVIITSENLDVATGGEVCFVSRTDAKIVDGKTVSIQKENADDTSLTYIIYK